MRAVGNTNTVGFAVGNKQLLKPPSWPSRAHGGTRMSDQQHVAPSASPRQTTPPWPGSRIDSLFKVTPREALDLLSAGIEVLVGMAGDVPPPPPLPPTTTPPVPQTPQIQPKTESRAQTRAEKHRAELVAAGILDSPLLGERPTRRPSNYGSALDSISAPTPEPIDGVYLRDRNRPQPGPSSEPQQQKQQQAQEPAPPEPRIVGSGDPREPDEQRRSIMRKFATVRAPPISVTQYLGLIHELCPMSTGVYLAASLYLRRMAAGGVGVVTAYNAHRLVLAALRVASKALEDGPHKHKLVAAAGGVGAAELAWLEVGFCLLTRFELLVRDRELVEECELLRGAGC